MKSLKLAVIGAGAGGQSMAAVLADKGYHVKLQDINDKLVEDLNKLDKITLTGKCELSAKPDVITTDVKEAIEDVDVIMVVTTADAHETVAKAIASFIKPNQIVVLNPGFIGGSLCFKKTLRDNGCAHDILIAETADLIYTCRKVEIGVIFHSGLKKRMEIAAVPANATMKVLEILKPIFPILTPAENILYTGLKNFGFILHCIPMIMNVNRIDAHQTFEYYMDGITPSIAKIAERVDLERIAVAKTFGLDIPTVVQSISKAYGVEGDNLYDVIQANKAYEGIKSPCSLEHRFLKEDAFGSLVPFASIAREFGVPTPGMNAIIEIISLATGIDYAEVGRNAEKIGISGKSKDEIYEMIL